MGEENKAAPAPAAPAPAAPAPASGGGKGGSKVVIIIVIVVVALGIIGYAAQRYFARKLAEKTANSILSGVTGGKVSVDSSDNGGVAINSNGQSTATGSKAKWPETMPTAVPEFKYGTIAYSSNSDTADYKAWDVTYTDVSTGAGTKYAAEVIAKGFTQTDTMTTNDITVTSYENDTYRLTVTLDPSSNGVSITVGLK